MSSLRQHIWIGESERQYTYFIREWPALLAPVPGTFIFACAAAQGGWLPIFIGECDDLSVLADSKLARRSLDQYGVTHIHTRPNLSPESVRQQQVDDLVARWRPPANRACGRN